MIGKAIPQMEPLRRGSSSMAVEASVSRDHEASALYCANESCMTGVYTRGCQTTFPPPLKHRRDGERPVCGTTVSVTPPGPVSLRLAQSLVTWRMKAESNTLKEAWWWCRGDRKSQPGRAPRRLRLSWALLAPTWKSSIWVAEAGG